jgi:hypothetical protein
MPAQKTNKPFEKDMPRKVRKCKKEDCEALFVDWHKLSFDRIVDSYAIKNQLGVRQRSFAYISNKSFIIHFNDR